MILSLVTGSWSFGVVLFCFLMNSTLFKLQHRKQGRFLHLEGSWGPGSIEGTGLQILLNFILVKQFHSQMEHAISSLLNFPVILSPQNFVFISGLLRSNVGRHKGLYQDP